jgi:hypothetical protein
MKLLTKFLSLVIVVTNISFVPMHESHIKIISPKLNSSYSKGQIVDINFKITFDKAIKEVSYIITDQTGKAFLTQKITGNDRKIIEEQNKWQIDVATPSIFKLSITSVDFTGHSQTKKVQFKVNF